MPRWKFNIENSTYELFKNERWIVVYATDEGWTYNLDHYDLEHMDPPPVFKTARQAMIHAWEWL